MIDFFFFNLLTSITHLWLPDNFTLHFEYFVELFLFSRREKHFIFLIFFTVNLISLGENGNRCRLSSSVFLNLNSDRMSMSGSNSFKKNRSNARTTVDNLSLVEECSSFRLELGGDVFKGLGLCGDLSQRRMMKLNSVNILDRVRSVYKKEILDLIDSNTSEPFITEFQDWGAYFYRVYFMNQEHATYLGNDPQIGPCAISIKREKLCTDVNGLSGIRNVSANTVKGQVKKSANGHDASSDGAEKTYEYAYRLIFRSSDVSCCFTDAHKQRLYRFRDRQ